MFAFVLFALAVTAVIAYVITLVRNDRPVTAPRSHTHELDPRSSNLRAS